MSIKIDLKIFLFLFLFLLTSQIEIYLLLMVFAILHELGHLIAGLILKFKAEEIKITPVGLQIRFKTNAEEYKNMNEFNIKKAIIVLAGPLTNFLIATIFIVIATFNIEFRSTYMYQIIIYSNFLIGIFNLIPIYPLDGGRFLNEILKITVGNKKAYKYTYFVSKTILIILTAISSIAILYLQNIAIVIILGYLWYLEIVEIRRYNKRKNIEKIVKQAEEKEAILSKWGNGDGHFCLTLLPMLPLGTDPFGSKKMYKFLNLMI